jgi:hypothetical protein
MVYQSKKRLSSILEIFKMHSRNGALYLWILYRTIHPSNYRDWHCQTSVAPLRWPLALPNYRCAAKIPTIHHQSTHPSIHPSMHPSNHPFIRLPFDIRPLNIIWHHSTIEPFDNATLFDNWTAQPLDTIRHLNYSTLFERATPFDNWLNDSIVKWCRMVQVSNGRVVLNSGMA